MLSNNFFQSLQTQSQDWESRHLHMLCVVVNTSGHSHLVVSVIYQLSNLDLAQMTAAKSSNGGYDKWQAALLPENCH